MKKRLWLTVSFLIFNYSAIANVSPKKSDDETFEDFKKVVTENEISTDKSHVAPKKPIFGETPYKRYLLENPEQRMQEYKRDEELSHMYQEFDYTEFDNKEMKKIFLDAPEFVQAHVNAIKYPFGIDDELLEEKLLLYGPPGSGKTTLAKAIACYLKRRCVFIKVPYLSTTYQDSGSVNLRAIISHLLKQNEPFVIILDEITGLTENYQSEHSNRHNYALSLVTVMDDCNARKGVFLIGTANKINGFPPAIKSRFGGNMVYIGQLKSSQEKIKKIRSWFINRDFIDFQVKDEDAIWDEIVEITNDYTHRDIKKFVASVLLFARFITKEKIGQKNKDIKHIIVTTEAFERTIEQLKIQEENAGKTKEDPISQQERLHDSSMKHSVDLNRVLEHTRGCSYLVPLPKEKFKYGFEINERICKDHHQLTECQADLAESYNTQIKQNRRIIEKKSFTLELNKHLEEVVKDKPFAPHKLVSINRSSYARKMEQYNEQLQEHEEKVKQTRESVEYWKNKLEQDPDVYLKIRQGKIAFDLFDLNKD